jgi:hypothetical protein
MAARKPIVRRPSQVAFAPLEQKAESALLVCFRPCRLRNSTLTSLALGLLSKLSIGFGSSLLDDEEQLTATMREIVAVGLATNGGSSSTRSTLSLGKASDDTEQSVQPVQLRRTHNMPNLVQQWTTSVLRGNLGSGVAMSWIDGDLVDSDQHADSFDPATGVRIGSYAQASRADVERAVQAAVRAFKSSDWKDNRRLRSKVLHQLAGRFEARREDLIQILSLESVVSFFCKECRGDKTAIELFIAGIRGWEAGLRRRLDVD